MPRLNLGRRGSRRRPDGAADRGHLEVMRWLCDAGGRRPCACRTRSSASGPPRRAAVSMSVPAKAVDSPELRQFLLDAWQFGTRSRRISRSGSRRAWHLDAASRLGVRQIRSGASPRRGCLGFDLLFSHLLFAFTFLFSCTSCFSPFT